MTATPDLSDRERLGLSTLEFVIIIAGLMSLNALAIDIMLPALPDIAAAFDIVEGNDRQLVIYIYVLGFGMPQLVWGPITDAFGRRGVIFMALGGYVLMALACMFTQGGFGLLLVMRFVQGVFASGCRVVAVSIVRDVFAGRGMARIMSLVMTIFMVVPILAPSIGQLVLYVSPWQGIFGVLAGMAALMMAWAWFRLPETLPEARRKPLSLGQAFRSYAQVYRSRVTFGYMVASGVTFGALFAFIGSAEQVYTEVFETGDAFVLWFAGVALAMSAASFTNSRLVERFGMRRISHGALIAFIALSAGLIGAMEVFGERFVIFFPVFAMIFACFGMIGSNFNALAMEPLGEIAGTASAAYGFFTTTFSALLGLIIGRQYDGSSIPLITGFAVLGAVSLIIVFVTERGKLFSSR